MLITGIKSKPVYSPLRADTGGRHHVMVGIGAASAALLRVLAELESADASALARTRVLFLPESAWLPPGPPSNDASSTQAASAAAPPFENLGLLEVQYVEDVAMLLVRLRAILDASLMGTRLYLAGPESFIGRAMTIALAFNMYQDEIRAEQIGSTARRVHCIHCRRTAEGVRTNIVRCGGCDRWLLVRDHYSRRWAAYMGVMVDAEAPGELPAVREIYG